MEKVETEDRVEILFAAEGHAKHFGVNVGPRITVKEFAVAAASAAGIEGIVEVFLEDADAPLRPELLLIEHLAVDFPPLHLARPGKIKTTVHYGRRHVEHHFTPNTTITKTIAWAFSQKELELEGSPADFQLKHDKKVLSPDLHLGQVAHGAKEISLELVFKVKPQG